MGVPVQFKGCNTMLGPPVGFDETSVRSMSTFSNGVHSVSCWAFTAKEVEEINRTGHVFVSVFSGKSQPPIYIGTEEDTRNLIADSGVWRK